MIYLIILVLLFIAELIYFCIANQHNIIDKPNERSSHSTIEMCIRDRYTGTLRKIFGIMNLVEAFKMVKDRDVELWICGSGDRCV